jgi:uncharacterized membrane protein (DUF485 family)
MQQDLVNKVKNHPKYMELVRKRSIFAWFLTIVMLVIYYAFILVIAFDKQMLAGKLSEGGVTSVGIPIGMFIILSAFVLTGIYVWRANTEFDELTRQIKEDVK